MKKAQLRRNCKAGKKGQFVEILEVYANDVWVIGSNYSRSMLKISSLILFTPLR